MLAAVGVGELVPGADVVPDEAQLADLHLHAEFLAAPPAEGVVGLPTVCPPVMCPRLRGPAEIISDSA